MQIQASGFFIISSNVVVPKNLQIETIVCWLCISLLSPALHFGARNFQVTASRFLPFWLLWGSADGKHWGMEEIRETPFSPGFWVVWWAWCGVHGGSHSGLGIGGSGWHHFPLRDSSSREYELLMLLILDNPIFLYKLTQPCLNRYNQFPRWPCSLENT